MTRRNVIILSVLLLAVAAGVIVAYLWSPRERQKQIRAFTGVPEHFELQEVVKLGEPLVGQWANATLAQGTPWVRFAVGDSWAELELLDIAFVRPEQKEGRVEYEGIFEDTTLVYEIYDGFVQQKLILESPQALMAFRFKLRLSDDLEAGERMGGFIPLYRKGTTDQIMQVRQPVAVDRRGTPFGYEYRTEPVGEHEYELRLVPSDSARLASAVFPVTIDPSIQSSSWDEALVKVGENGKEEGNLMDGDIADIKPAGWGWGVEERKKFVVVMVPRLSAEERARFLSTAAGAAKYGIDYTKLMTRGELEQARSKRVLNPFIDARHLPTDSIIVKKQNRLGSMVPDERRLAYRLPTFWQRAVMSLVRPVFAAVTKKIAQGGGNNCPSGTACDYSTIQLWEDGEDGDLVTLDEIHKGETYNDGGAFNEAVTIDGSTTDATRYMWLTVAAGEQHNGTAGTGVILNRSVSGSVITISDSYTVFERFELTETTGRGSANYLTITSSLTGILLNKLLMHDITSSWSLIATENNANSSFELRNCILYDATVNDALYSHAGTGTGTVNNCTVYNGSNGLQRLSGTLTVKNTISINNVAADDIAASAGSSNNITGDASGNLPNRTATDNPSPGVGDWVIFANLTAGSEDFHLQDSAENDAIDAGTDLSGTFTDDIDGETRSGTWDMGADELLVTPSITSVTDTPDPTNPNRSVTFSIDWSDPQSGETVKVKVCKSSTLSAQNCTDGFWASSTAFTTSDPESLVYDIVGGDAGTTRNYFVHVCDDGAACTATSTAGTFSVNAASTVPNVKVRGGTKFRGGTVR